jgi:hypothetical protein
MMELTVWVLGLALVRIIVGIARKKQGRFVSFYTVLLYSAVGWLPLLVNLKLWVTKP